MTFTEDDMIHAASCVDRLEDIFGSTGTTLFVVAMVTAYSHPEWLQWWAAILTKREDDEARQQEAIDHMVSVMMPVPGAAR